MNSIIGHVLQGYHAVRPAQPERKHVIMNPLGQVLMHGNLR
jgi:hypothetical protein